MDIGAIDPAAIDDRTVTLRLLDRPLPLPSARAVRVVTTPAQVLATVAIRYTAETDVAYPAEHVEHLTIEPANGLSPAVMTRLPWAMLFRAARSFQRARTLNTVSAWRANTDTAVPRKIDRRALSDDHYREVARRYTELCSHGERAATSRLAEEWHTNRNTVASWVRRARQRGYLTAAHGNQVG